MQHYLVYLFGLALTTYCSNGLAIETRGKSAALAQTRASPSKAKRGHVLINPIFVRPHAGGVADVVSFGLRAMNFYGTDLKHHTFYLDVVMTIKWHDDRVVEKIPEGLDKLTMSYDQADQTIWTPGLNVTNRDIEKYEIISSTVTIYRSGDVLRVERANTRVVKKFMLEGYPFDTQHLVVNIASSKYMLDEVRLEPDRNASGVYEDIWGLYDLDKWNVSAYNTHDGPLEKSRGSIDIAVSRTLDKYSQDHLVPAFIVLMISWAVFYFPFANPFITARLCLSILALLQFTNLIVKSTKELPGAAPFNWNDLLNQQIQFLMFVTIVFNIASEIGFHTFQNEELSKSMNNEAKILMPFMSIVNVVLILGSGKYHWMALETATRLTQGVIFVCIAAYIVYAVKENTKRKAEREAMEADAEKCT